MNKDKINISHDIRTNILFKTIQFHNIIMSSNFEYPYDKVK